jgi:hypothetical protein
LRDIYFIEGIGLCSNIFIFAEGESISLVDTGSGMEPNAVNAQLERLGLEIEAVTRVVITHGHLDHIRGTHGDMRALLTKDLRPPERCRRLEIHRDQDSRLHGGWRQYPTWPARPKNNPFSWPYRGERVPARRRNHSHWGHCFPRRVLWKNGPPVRRLEKARGLIRQVIPFGRSSHAAGAWRTAAIRGILASQTGSENRTRQILANLTRTDRMRD